VIQSFIKYSYKHTNWPSWQSVCGFPPDFERKFSDSTKEDRTTPFRSLTKSSFAVFLSCRTQLRAQHQINFHLLQISSICRLYSFIVLLPKSSAAQNIVYNSRVTDELGRMWVHTVEAQLRAQSRNFTGKAEQNYEKS
jgi:hypothetical protein